MNKAIISPITPHADRIYSHRTAWGRLWSKETGSNLLYSLDWSKSDTVYFEHGMEFDPSSKGVNVFLKEEDSWNKLAIRAQYFIDFSGDLISLDIDCPDYGERLKSRVKEHSSLMYKSLDFKKITERCKESKTLKQVDLKKQGLVLGDSHSLSAWREDLYISRNDGKTLNGALKENLIEKSVQFFKKEDVEFKILRTYFGNIDIRHHICRLGNSYKERTDILKSLTLDYFKQLYKVQEKYKISNIEVVYVLPIENESRKLPKTGYYKNKPFWGSWQERTDMKNKFNDLLYFGCKELGFNKIVWPEKFENEQGELDFAYMEKPQSVHLSPEHYLWSAI
jgi:hypothetical protein